MRESRYPATFNTKMRSAYVICALLGVTLVLADNGTEPATTAQSLNSSAAVINDSGITAAPITNATTESTTKSTVTTTNPNSTSTTIVPTPPPPPTTTTTTSTTTATPTTTISTTTASSTTLTPKPTKSTSPAPSPTVTPTDGTKTTAVPPSSKDRQFDGLSFFGGIVLTTCLMAIAAFSWKFYRQCKEGNYRTL